MGVVLDAYVLSEVSIVRIVCLLLHTAVNDDSHHLAILLVRQLDIGQLLSRLHVVLWVGQRVSGSVGQG